MKLGEKLFAGGVIVGLMAASFIFGIDHGQTIFEPQVVIVEVPSPPEIRIIKGDVVEKEVVVEKFVELSDWESPEELAAFLAEDNTDSIIRLQANADGVIKFDGQCEVTAKQLRTNAAARGKRLDIYPMHRAEYHKWYDTRIEDNHYHVVLLAIVGNNEFYYYVDQDTDKIWLAHYPDEEYAK